MHRPTWHAAQYEFEDLLVQLDDVDLLTPPPQHLAELSRFSRRAVNGTLRRIGAPRRSPTWRLPSVRPTTVGADHDLFFAVFHHPYQLSYLQRLKGWRERCRRAVAFVLEVWSPEIDQNSDFLRILRDFDMVYVANPHVGPALTALGIPRLADMSSAVDAVRFCPLPAVPERVLGFFSYGRSSPSVHRGLLDLVEREGLTYLYDTREGPVTDPGDHRALLANMMKRSEFFLTHRINDTPSKLRITGGDECLSTRYFEGAAGGAVMIGSHPVSSDFDESFDWEDAVVPLPYDSTAVADILAELRSQPERQARIRSTNVRQSLLRHDWVHRWQRVLDDGGLPASAAVVERHEQLRVLAAAADEELFAPGPHRAA